MDMSVWPDEVEIRQFSCLSLSFPFFCSGRCFHYWGNVYAYYFLIKPPVNYVFECTAGCHKYCCHDLYLVVYPACLIFVIFLEWYLSSCICSSALCYQDLVFSLTLNFTFYNVQDLNFTFKIFHCVEEAPESSLHIRVFSYSIACTE